MPSGLYLRVPEERSALMESKKCPAYRFVEYYLRKYTSLGQLAIDIGCGTAPYRQSTSCRYVGLDLMREPYKKDYPRDVDVVGSALKLPFYNNTFDLIFCVAVFFILHDHTLALREFYRVVKPGGRVLIFDYNRRTHKRLERADHDKLPGWRPKELKSLVEGVGFKDCELLAPVTHGINQIEKHIRLIKEELIGQWAIVTGVKY